MFCGLLTITFILGSFTLSYAQSFDSKFVREINELRSTGCRCGGEWLKPAKSVTYNELLSRSAYLHAIDIGKQRRLNHFSRRGRNIGERVSAVGYNWFVVGENLAFGH